MNLITLVFKLSWLNQMRDEHLDPIAWMYFAASDIASFHVTLRALFITSPSTSTVSPRSPASLLPHSMIYKPGLARNLAIRLSSGKGWPR